jgi:hypothetical protein
MKLTLSVCAALALIVAMIGLAPVIGQDMGKVKEPAAAEKPAEPKTLDPNGVLKKLEGKFDMNFSLWMAPGADPIKLDFPMQSDWALDGQFLHSSYDLTEGPLAHKGVEYFGYNEATEEYDSTRLTSMSGAIIVYRGKYDKDKKTLELKAEYAGLWEGNKYEANSRAVYVWENDDKYTCTIYTKYKNIPGMEDEVKEVEIICTRAKK